jgi:hypothetical protein
VNEKNHLRATPLIGVVLILTYWHATRLWTAAAWYDVLREYVPAPGAVYTAFSGAFWLGVGSTLAWSLWREKAWAAKMLIGAAAGYTVWYWCDRLIFQVPRTNWPFILAVNLFLLVYILAAAIPRIISQDRIKRGL